MKRVMFGLLVLCCAAMAGLGLTRPADAYDSCSGGNNASRLAVKVAGDSSYPTYCKTAVCHPLTARSVKSVWDPYGGYWQTTYSYKMQANNSSMANACPSNVDSTWVNN